VADLDPEVAALIQRFERGIAETTAKFHSQGTVIVVGAVLFAGVAAVQQTWFLIPVCLGFAAGIFWLMKVAARNSGPERAAPVLEALKHAPGRVTRVSHRTTSDSKRIFVTHWVEVISDEGRIFVRANDDWEQLLAAVSKRCPQAAVER
jgi:hypothetical protein